MPSLTEVLGFLTGAVCVLLVVRQSIWNFPVGIANNVFFIVLFWRVGLYGDLGLQGVYIGLGLYGWWSWLHGGAGGAALEVSRTPWNLGLALGAGTVVATVALALALDGHTDSTTPWADALTTALSLAAQYMLSRKLLENWWVWIAADVIYVGLYLHKELYLTAVLYLLFMGLCVAGLAQWRKALVVRPAVVAG